MNADTIKRLSDDELYSRIKEHREQLAAIRPYFSRALEADYRALIAERDRRFPGPPEYVDR